jgi:pimeloyl-ACP methyl ester carboxylesterase
METLVTALIGITAIALVVGYNKLIPSDTEPLGSLPPNNLYKPDFWPEHGYADLPNGKTHYYLLGPKTGPRIVFVHGILTPPVALHSFLNALAQKGFRVLCYEQYGKGYSDSPGVVYNDELYISQLAALLQDLNWGKTDIIGYSLGGAITCGYVSRFPELVERVILLAPTGLMKVSLS